MLSCAKRPAAGFRFSITDADGQEVARASLFLITNDLHEKPYGLLEDLFVEPAARGNGHATQLVQAVTMKAREHECYKLIATSRTERPEVHAIYEHMGFARHGVEFRKDLS